MSGSLSATVFQDDRIRLRHQLTVLRQVFSEAPLTDTWTARTSREVQVLLDGLGRPPSFGPPKRALLQELRRHTSNLAEPELSVVRHALAELERVVD